MKTEGTKAVISLKKIGSIMKGILNGYLNSAWIPLLIFVILEISDTLVFHLALGRITSSDLITATQNSLLKASLFLSSIKHVSFIGVFVAIVVQLFRRRWMSVLISLLLFGGLFLLMALLVAADLTSAGL